MNGRRTTVASPLVPAVHRDVLEARVARRITARLSRGAEELPHDIGERLRVARQQAVERARQLRKLSAAPAWSHQGGAAVMSGPPE